MKYRLLALDELKELEPEFIRFLASNQITSDDWTSIKEKDPERVELLIALFSDIVMEKVLKKIDYAEQRAAGSLLLFKFTDQAVLLVGLNANEDLGIDFNNPACLKDLARYPEKYSGSVSYFKSERKYVKSREEELFSVIHAGALISDGKLFEALYKL